MKEIGIDEIKEIQAQAAQLMQEHKDLLTTLDSVIGDGDLGITMERAFSAGRAVADEYSGADLGEMLKRIGLTMSSAAPSTMGTLMASAYIGAGKALLGRKSLKAEDMHALFSAMADAAAARGGAQEGDKTLLDALCPAARAASEQTGGTMEDCLMAAHRAAETGLEKTKGMVNQHGKAAVYREKSIGHADPGAAAACLLIRAFWEVGRRS